MVMRQIHTHRARGRVSGLAVLFLAGLAIAVLSMGLMVSTRSVGDSGGGRQKVVPRTETFPEAGHSLSGQVRFDEGVDPRKVEVRVEVVDGSSTITLAFPLNARGDFFVADLPAGEVSVDFTMGQGQESLHFIANVPLESDGLATHLKVDLRGALHVFTFEIFGPFGEPARDAMLFWRKTREGGEQALYAHWVRGPSPHTITATSEWIDLAVVASGARVLEVPAVSFSRSLQLREGYPVRIALPDGVRPDEDGVSLALRLFALQPDPRFARATRRGRSILEETAEHLFEGDELECIVPALGVYEVRWRAYREVSRDGIQILHLEDRPGQIEVSSTSHANLFRPYFPLELYKEKLGSS
jgi:hypothetical protein